MRRLRRFATVALAAVGLSLSTFGNAVSIAQEYDHPVSGEYAFDMSATQALVNSAGGLFVAGQLSCPSATITQALSDAVQMAVNDGFTEADNASLADGAVFANANWVATQYVGRTKVVTARYDSGIASPCYGFPGGPPYDWRTLYPYPVGGDQWIYADNGKFATGRIHVEIFGTASPTINVYNPSHDFLAAYTAVFYNTSGWDLRAARYRTH